MKLRFLLIAVLLTSAARTAAQTNSSSVPDNFPQSLWMAHRKVTQIPWSVSVGKAKFRGDLRQELELGAYIRQVDLEKSGDSHDLIFYVRVLDGETPITSIHSVTPKESPLSPTAQSPILGAHWRQIAIVRPGKYKLEAALFDRITGRYNTRYEDFSVLGNENDTLEQAFRGFPRFEFVEAVNAEDRVLPPVSPRPVILRGVSIGVPLGAIRGANLNGRDLGVSNDPPPSFLVDSPRKLHLSVMTILSPPELALQDEYYLSLFQNNLTNYLSVLSRLDVVHGTAKLTGVDLTDRTLVFDRLNLKEVTREMLIGAIIKDTSTVSVDALTGKADRGRFLRDVLRAQFEEAEKETEGAEHVIMVVGARTDFPRGSSVVPLSPERDCHCRVIYLRFALQPNEADDIDSLLKAYKPRVFEPLDWQEFRKNFATIYEQLIR